MKLQILLLGLVAFTGTAQAMPSLVWWPGWTISSSEELTDGIKYPSYPADGGYNVPAYPISRLFDGDVKTEWVYSAKSKEWDKSQWKTPHGFTISADKPFRVNTIRLMNGQNFSAERFRRNHRVTHLRITVQNGGYKQVRDVRLPDHMGWHDIRLAPSRAKEIKFEILGLKRGQGPQADLCISELQLMNEGKRVDLRMPRAVIYADGFEGCGATYLITNTGQVIEGIATDVGESDSWSPSGRYVSGVAGPDERLWVADSYRATKIALVAPPSMSIADKEWLKKLHK